MRNTSIFLHYGCSVFWLTAFLCLFPIVTTAFDTITTTQPLPQGQTIVSAGNVFELGFFSSSNSQNRSYVGIWYKNMSPSTIVWVANRDNPLPSASGAIKIGEDGNVILFDGSANSLIWSSNKTSSSNTVAQLLDSGNFVLRRENDVDPANYIWQSFDYPTDTLLPGMKLGWDAQTGLKRYLTAWKTNDDPSSSNNYFKLDIQGFPEFFLLKKQDRIYRSGPWNGHGFSGVPEMNSSYILNFTFVMAPYEVTYSFELGGDKSLYSRLIVDPSGVLQRYTWIKESQVWNLFWYAPKDQCDTYMECGIYGVCDTDTSPVCSCLNGFEPKNPVAWELRDGSDGCVRTTQLNCRDDGFLTLTDMKLPETSNAVVNRSMTLAECEKACRSNCSCTGYASMDITGGGYGCVIWVDDLLDMRQYAAADGGQNLYVKVPASDLGNGSTGSGSSSGKSEKTVKVVGAIVGVGVLLLGLGLFFTWKRKRKQKRTVAHEGLHERSQDFLSSEGIIVTRRDYSGESTSEDLELPLFDFSTLVMATNNFSDENKLGQGGFGCVYKGMLVEGQEIAVKRLSKTSLQGVEEFKNEVKLIARLQHRNLVRLLGCCIQMEEKMLIYEYLENKSLDSILFNKKKCSLLNWQRRFNIICGIARGLLYLHQDSRFRIIHRDLKASNILLDGEMNPKISDFGMARIFGGDQIEGNTKRIVGTYGYMSPEYAMDGLFSVKSDVFSFGVLALEIISGKKNRGFYNADQELNLLGHAWKQWKEGKGLDLLDSSAGSSYSLSEVLQCIHVTLLCIQERAEDRPTMSSVVLMLSSESASMSQPKHPGFCLGRPDVETGSSSGKQDESCTVNQVTITNLGGR